MLLLLSSSMRALDLPKENAPPRPPPCICRMKKTQTPISSSIGNQDTKMLSSSDCSSSGRTLTCTPYFIRSPTIQMSFGALTVIGRPSLERARSVLPSTTTLSMRPSRASAMNCE